MSTKKLDIFLIFIGKQGFSPLPTTVFIDCTSSENRCARTLYFFGRIAICVLFINLENCL